MTRAASHHHPEAVPTPPSLYSRKRDTLLVLLATALGLQAGVQHVAYLTGYDASLGPGLWDASPWPYWRPAIALALACGAAALLWRPLRRGAGVLLLGAAWMALLSQGPLYNPLSGITWARHFLADPVLSELVPRGLVAAYVGFITALLAAVPLRSSPFRLRRSGSHGTAAWGEGKSLHAERGLLLGTQEGRRLRYDGEGHLLTVAPTGTGKGVGPILSNLLAYEGSVVVTDPKGENYAVSGRWRALGLGHRVCAFDPFGVAGGQAAFNPLDLVDTGRPDAIDDARALADMMVTQRGRMTENDTHFAEEGKELLAGLILYVAYAEEGEERSLVRVRELLTLDPVAFDDLLEEMLASAGCGGLIQRAAAKLLQKAEKERSGVISSAQRHTHFLDSAYVQRCLTRTTAPLLELKRRPLSVYLILPMERLDSYAPWLRLMIAACWMAVVRDPARPARRTLFLLDEFANLGRMDQVARATALLRGYGATIWLFAQSLAQLKATYPESWEALLDVDVLQAFGTNDPLTAEHLSKMAGEETAFASSQNAAQSSGRRRGRGWQRSYTFSEKTRRLILPDEVRRLGPEEQLLFVKGEAPVRAKRLRYYAERELARRAAPNPYYHAEP